eukprot:bmy_00476T0
MDVSTALQEALKAAFFHDDLAHGICEGANVLVPSPSLSAYIQLWRPFVLTKLNVIEVHDNKKLGE